MSWHLIPKPFLTVIESVFVVALLAFAGWMRYRQAKLNEERKDRKSEIQTLFDGKK